jgi:hypothetical protein
MKLFRPEKFHFTGQQELPPDDKSSVAKMERMQRIFNAKPI